MRRCSRPFRRRPEALPSLRRAALALAALGIALGPLAGCVTRGTHQEVVSQRDDLLNEKARLQERVGRLQASTQSLDSERVKLIDQMEDLRQQQEEAEKNLRQLRKSEKELSEVLAVQEQELESRGQEISRLRDTYEGLVSDLETELAAGQIEIQQLRDGLQLNLAQEVLFASGSAQVSSGGQTVLGKVAERIGKAPYRVVVQGHTDNVPIATSRFPSNWELAGARATRVVRILARDGVPPERLSAVSHGEFSPRAPNDSSKGRSRNRRIEINLMPIPTPGRPGEAEAPAGAAGDAPKPAASGAAGGQQNGAAAVQQNGTVGGQQKEQAGAAP